MKAHCSITLVVAAATICSASFAAANCKKIPPPSPVVSKVVATGFTLKQVSTQTLNDSTSISRYKGEAVLTITSPDPAVLPVDVAVKVELRTQTRLSALGDGLTDGVISLYAPATKQLISGPVMAINENFGELTGILDGGLCGFGSTPVRLRAAFRAVFVADADGNYTLVNVEAHGVQVALPRAQDHKK